MQQIYSTQESKIRKVFDFFEKNNFFEEMSHATFNGRCYKDVLNFLDEEGFKLFSTEVFSGKYSQNLDKFYYKSNNVIVVTLQIDLDSPYQKKFYEDDSLAIVSLYSDCPDITSTEHFKKISNIKTPIYVSHNLNLVASSSNGSLYTKSFKLSNKDIFIDFDLNYNKNFLEVHKLIEHRIQNTSDGIVILHGKPGTGKTSYIKWLLQNINKKVIFLPPYLAEKLASPSFIEFLQEQCSNSLLVIEDAEEILKSRDTTQNSTISTILNISDGLLSDIFNIQILATINCNIDEIDSALQRKGRIIAQYEFEELSKDRAQKLSDKLGFNSIITKDTLLTDVFNQNEKSFKEDKYKIGV